MTCERTGLASNDCTHRYIYFSWNPCPIKAPVLSISEPRFQILLLDERIDVFTEREEGQLSRSGRVDEARSMALEAPNLVMEADDGDSRERFEDLQERCFDPVLVA
jgi:hypothetical protein